jgi:hypothetical protein
LDPHLALFLFFPVVAAQEQQDELGRTAAAAKSLKRGSDAAADNSSSLESSLSSKKPRADAASAFEQIATKTANEAGKAMSCFYYYQGGHILNKFACGPIMKFDKVLIISIYCTGINFKI